MLNFVKLLPDRISAIYPSHTDRISAIYPNRKTAPSQRIKVHFLARLGFLSKMDKMDRKTYLYYIYIKNFSKNVYIFCSICIYFMLHFAKNTIKIFLYA